MTPPAVRVERLSKRQREGTSCVWCAGHPDRRFRVRPPGTSLKLYCCAFCAARHGIREGR
ncbi:hypothetical protein [Streptomyces boncukensis]|uniref:Uncharacterized protein n=1 Tax=Streptomyces boncukensis TaxID=2711219 RepID=A0A6G4WZ08_9ACTN|nr:hypothetical protein [Streptomyces boncukensis]NGO70529.1 hypothetical protein [Streptomyces boncukensis]